MIEDLWNDLVAALYSSLFGIKEQLWDTVSGMYYETLYSYFAKSAGPLTDAFSGLVMASYVGVVVAAGLIILSYETLQTKYSLRELVPRLIIAVLLVGLAKEITWQVFSNSLVIVDAFTLSDRVHTVACGNFPDGSDVPIDVSECEGYESKMRSVFANHAFMVPTGPNAEDPVGLVDVGMQLVSIWCYLVLIVMFLLRNIAWFCVLIMAPLALACHALPQTERFAHYWWRLLGACLASSLGQAALIWVYHQLEGTVADQYVEDFHFQLFYIVLIVWLMWKLHKKAFELARGTRVNVPGSRLFMGLVISRVLNGRSSGRKHTPHRRRRSSPDHDTTDWEAVSSVMRRRNRPVQHPQSQGQREWEQFRLKANAFHEANGTKPGGPVKRDPASGPVPGPPAGAASPPPGRAPAPAGDTDPRHAPSPVEVAERIDNRSAASAPGQNFEDHEAFRRRADALYDRPEAPAHRQRRDAGQARRRDRSADAIDAQIDTTRSERRRSSSRAGLDSEPGSRRAEDRTASRMMPPRVPRAGGASTPIAPSRRPGPKPEPEDGETSNEGGER